MASAGKLLADAASQYLEAQVKNSVRGVTERLEDQGLAGLRPNLPHPHLPKPHLPKLGGDGSGRPSVGQGRPTVVVEDLVIGVPVDVAYEQWTNYPEVPEWSKGVQSVDESADGDGDEDGETTRWRAKVLWSKRSWEAKVLEEVPEQRLVWRSEGDGVELRGALTFHPLAEDATLLLLVLEYRPRGLVEHVGNLFRAPGRRVRLDLKRFRSYVTWQDHREDEEGEDGEGEAAADERDEEGEPGQDGEGAEEDEEDEEEGEEES